MNDDTISAAAHAQPRDPQPTGRYRLEFVGLDAAGQKPRVAIAAVDAAGTRLHAQEADAEGGFTLPPDVLKRAHRVLLGEPDAKGGVLADTAISYRADDFAASAQRGVLPLAEGVWSVLRRHWVCVSGSVQACRRRPWWFDSIVSAAIQAGGGLRQSKAAALAQRAAVPSLNDLVAWPVRCAPVCLGRVDVYRRTCCCWPIVFDDPRIDDLIRNLEIYVEKLPRLPRPKPGFPPPPPPLGDPLKTPFFKGGAMNELALNAPQDLRLLRGMPRDQAAQYINTRPYLFHKLCSCSHPVKVGSGAIHPDGHFSICWLEPWRFLLPNCYEQYAYVVTQTIGGTSTKIYDGLEAGAWFAAGDHPVLRSYHRGAFTCGETGTGGDGDAYVFLDLIGDTESHELTTPASTGWNRVAAPDATSGLLFPGTGPNNSHLRNLGGAIELSFVFSLGMRAPAVGARYYRLSICQADALGQPVGPRHYYDQGLAWQKVAGADIVPESLGPVPPATVGGEANLYRIPYSDEPWVGSVRYHALIDTLKPELNVPPTLPVDAPGHAANVALPAVNHLVTLEVFNAAGERLRPLGSPASGQPGLEAAKPFKFRRWFQPGGSVGDDTVEVPFAALTHLFCWDNRPPVADITRLVKDGAASNEECQFLSGTPVSTFAIEYRAYVADQRFQYGHGVGWVRGLNASAANGGVGSLPTPLSPANVGEPPAAAAVSGSNTFQQMLTRLDPPNPPTVLPRCSFAVTLTTFSKTTNGESLSYPHVSETAAFALAIDP